MKPTIIPDTQINSYYDHIGKSATERQRVLNILVAIKSPICRSELCALSGLPLNHVTRVVNELLQSGDVEVCGKKINPCSGKMVQSILINEKRQHDT